MLQLYTELYTQNCTGVFNFNNVNNKIKIMLCFLLKLYRVVVIHNHVHSPIHHENVSSKLASIL